jgi:hypothetical protein
MRTAVSRLTVASSLWFSATAEKFTAALISRAIDI